MMQVLLAAPASGGGKTTVTCALLAALQARGLSPCAFKCGPDYIDPMFHRAVLGVESRNLDLFLSSEETVRRLFAQGAAGHGAAVCEGVMGYYDGVGGVTDRASPWHVATVLELPVVLVVRPGGSALTLAAQIQGLCRFRENSRIAAVLLNDCSPALCRQLTPVLEGETGIPVLGCLPRMEEARFESRHLGLRTAAEIGDLTRRVAVLGRALEENAHLDRLLALCGKGGEAAGPQTRPVDPKTRKIRLAVASDKAFCFTYQETLEALEAAGAELAPFCPLTDRALPEGIGGLYLPGGYPELYAQALSENRPLAGAIAAAVKNGRPTVAECGGFLYLGQTLEDDKGQRWPMAGALPGAGVRRDKLVRFGYARMTAHRDSLLFRAGETVPVHEFHYWDSTENGADFSLEKPVSGQTWQGGFATATLYAGFPHLYFAGHPALAERFVAAAGRYLGDGYELVGRT